jgi:hypothetical protein
MMGGHDRRLAKLENSAPISPTISEDHLSLVTIVFGPERASKVKRTGFDGLDAQERQHLMDAVDAEIVRRDAPGVAW